MISDGEIVIGAGRYYVDGLLCENPAPFPTTASPILVRSSRTAPAPCSASWPQSSETSVLQVYLEVWQRLVTALDDPCLREPALGQADTTARLQTVWRVVADVVRCAPRRSPARVRAPSCCQDMYAAAAPQPSTGTMTAGTSGPSADCGCAPVAAAGYQGIENQLYRVEIHTGPPARPADLQVVAGERLGRLGGHERLRRRRSGSPRWARTPTSASSRGSGSS